MRILIRSLIVLAGCMGLLFQAGCVFMPQVEVIEGTARDEALQTAEPIADSIFSAIQAHDYAAFSSDFDDTMKKALDEKAFNEMVTMFDERIGKYQSREVEKVERVDEVIVVSYRARFEKEDVVSARISIRETDPPEVAGIWFDSPKLRIK